MFCDVTDRSLFRQADFLVKNNSFQDSRTYARGGSTLSRIQKQRREADNRIYAGLLHVVTGKKAIVYMRSKDPSYEKALLRYMKQQ